MSRSTTPFVRGTLVPILGVFALLLFGLTVYTSVSRHLDAHRHGAFCADSEASEVRVSIDGDLLHIKVNRDLARTAEALAVKAEAMAELEGELAELENQIEHGVELRVLEEKLRHQAEVHARAVQRLKDRELRIVVPAVPESPRLR